MTPSPNVAEELDLIRRKVSMGTRHLSEDMARIDKQYLVLARGTLLALV
jgi:hypothetical protein